MAQAALKQQHQENLRENERKWTKPLMDAGWTAFPSVILDNQRKLGLEPIDVNILLQILKHWWYADRLPYPSKRHVAEAIGVTARTVQRRIARMEKNGLIARIARKHHVHGSDTNKYDVAGLVTKLTSAANEVITRKEQKRVDASVRRSGHAGLRLVKDK